MGGFISNGSDLDFAVVRYNINGSLDSSFGFGGIVTTAIGDSDDVIKSIAIQDDGKIIAAAKSIVASDYDFAVVRYNNDGSLDTSFGLGGIVTTAIGTADDRGWSVAIDSNGKIILAGFSSNGTDWDFALVRYNNDGSLDSAFGVNGKVTTAIGNNADVAYSVAIQQDGKIIAAGFSNNGFDLDFAIVRYNGDDDATKIMEETGNIGEQLSVYPNPFTNKTIIKSTFKGLEVKLKVFDVIARIVHHQSLNFKEETLNLNLPLGIYFYQVHNGQRTVASGKLIVGN